MATNYSSSSKRIYTHYIAGGLALSKYSASDEDTSGNEMCSDEELELAITPCFPYGDSINKRVHLQDRQNKCHRLLNPYFVAYLQLFENEVIQDFLWVDSCAKLADKYLLAMVYVYFRRASLPLDSYNAINFFIALYLANDIEEDDEDEKYEIFPWALGKGWMTQFPLFLRHRDQLWHDMGFRAVVSRLTCEEVIAMAPHHDIWRRKRLPHHGGAIRPYLRKVALPNGRTSPKYCSHCIQAKQFHDNAEATPMKVTNGLDLIDEIDLAFQRSSEKGGLQYKGSRLNFYREE